MTPGELTSRLAAGPSRAGAAPGEAAGSTGMGVRWGSVIAGCDVSQDLVTVTVTPAGWLAAARFARDELECGFFDWLSAVDELAAGLAVLAHVYSLTGRHHLLLRTVLPASGGRLATMTGIYRGAAWHERETSEMFGVVFEGHPRPGPLLLPDGFEGHPLRKDFVLAARAAQDWPGAKEPGEGGGRAPARRRLAPPGVPEGWPPG